MGRYTSVTQLRKTIKSVFKGHSILSNLQGEVIRAKIYTPLSDRESELRFQKSFQKMLRKANGKVGRDNAARASLPRARGTVPIGSSDLQHYLQELRPPPLARQPALRCRVLHCSTVRLAVTTVRWVLCNKVKVRFCTPDNVVQKQQRGIRWNQTNQFRIAPQPPQDIAGKGRIGKGASGAAPRDATASSQLPATEPQPGGSAMYLLHINQKFAVSGPA